jgi:hypothetical protein
MSAYAESPEITNDYHCRGCGNRAEFVGTDARGYPGDACDCGREECVCVAELTQPFTVGADGEVHYATFTGGGSGAEIGAYTSINCAACGALVWSEPVAAAA